MSATAGDAYAAQPWKAQYAPQRPQSIAVDWTDALAMFRAAVERAADKPALRYFDGTLTYRELDEQSDALALALQARGFGPGDRLALFLQNVPQFPIGQLAAWKAGGIAVSINPMNKQREVKVLLEDSGAKALLLHRALYRDVAAEVLAELASPVLAIATSEREYQTRNDTRVLPAEETPRIPGVLELSDLIATYRGGKPAPVTFAADDTALLTYTSGTTGVPKGAMNTHGNIGFTAQIYRDWMDNPEGSSVYALAPLFHITGLIGHIALAQLIAGPLGLTYRFEPNVTLEALQETQAQFTIGAITAFIALMNHPGATREHFASMRHIFSGGASIPPTVVEQFEKTFGHRIHCAYGLTESTSPATATPLDSNPPVDPASGSLSIGTPVYLTHIRIEGDDGSLAPPGEIGEIVISGPQIVKGYWNKPEESQRSIPGGSLKTGDVGFMDAGGWFYLVDRKKDMINAAGYKVWPREVEDVLYTHPAIREAAVVGIPDEYRGETVKAVVSLKPGATLETDDLVAFCRTRMAAYKVPRVVRIVDDLPKTVTGKILRRMLRDEPAAVKS
jgi:long-chain acyl-CoA synthetase